MARGESNQSRSTRPPPPDPFLGGRIPSELVPGVQYLVERKLGEGGTAAAYFARRESSSGTAPVVLKIILPSVVATAGDTAAMVVQKEAVALGRLNERAPPTAFVVRLLDAGSVELRGPGSLLRLPWLAVEYVHGGIEGTTLEERVDYSLRQTGFGFEPERAERLVRHVCEGMTEIHEVGVIHRDITPNNVLCCGFADTEMFKISDFGIARPMGMKATFGDVVLGTPGFLAPEQAFATSEGAGPYSDIFGLAAVTYYMLTGQLYFVVTSPVQALMAAKAEERRSLLDAPTLCPELRERPDLCHAIDQALKRATSAEPAQRPQTARAFGASVLPWLEQALVRSGHGSRRHVTTMTRLRAPESAPGWSWAVRRTPGDDRVVSSVGWDADGHCLASTTAGLAFWDGTGWSSVPDRELPIRDGIEFVRRVGSGRWLVGGASATLAEYSRSGVTRILRGSDEAVTFSDASGEVADLAVVVGRRHGWPPLLCGLAAGRWLKPMPVDAAVYIAALARIDDTHWVVAGRGREGHAYAAIYAPLLWELDPIEVPRARALLACASRPEREVALAVGAEGVALRISRGQVAVDHLDGAPDLSAAAVDVLGRQWAGGAGQLWMSAAPGLPWSRVWRDPTWHAPFVSIFADPGLVVTMTVDGAVLECRSSLSQIGSVAG